MQCPWCVVVSLPTVVSDCQKYFAGGKASAWHRNGRGRAPSFTAWNLQRESQFSVGFHIWCPQRRGGQEMQQVCGHAESILHSESRGGQNYVDIIYRSPLMQYYQSFCFIVKSSLSHVLWPLLDIVVTGLVDPSTITGLVNFVFANWLCPLRPVIKAGIFEAWFCEILRSCSFCYSGQKNANF